MKKYRFLSLLLALALALPLTAHAVGSVPDMWVQGTSALLMDADHNEALYEQSAHEKRFPASITKVVTALVVLDAVDEGKIALDDMVTATEPMNRDLSIYGSTQNIKVGEMMSVDDLLRCMVISSANEAANILAIYVAGDLDSFMALMNQRAKDLGCENTHFSNAHGLHDENHYTTAHDIYLFMSEAMKHPTFREIVALKNYEVPATNVAKARTLRSTNALVSNFHIRGYIYPSAIGGKTGSTPEAGQCLVSVAQKDGKTLYAVVMGAENMKQADDSVKRMAFSESSRMFEWGFTNFERRQVLDSIYTAGTLPVTLASKADQVAVQAQGVLEATLSKGLDPADFDKNPVFTVESLEAPVSKGQVVGSVSVSYQGKEYGTLPLVAVADVERSELLYRIDQVKRFFDQLWVKIVVLALLLVALFFLLRWLLFSKRRRHGARGSGRRPTYSGRRKK